MAELDPGTIERHRSRLELTSIQACSTPIDDISGPDLLAVLKEVQAQV